MSEDDRIHREATKELSRRIREAAGFDGDQTMRDTAGNVVRDETGRFVGGHGMDGGQRGEPVAPAGPDMNERIRNALNGRQG
jgi:hypothetical protein